MWSLVSKYNMIASCIIILLASVIYMPKISLKISVPIFSSIICIWLLAAYNLSFWQQVWQIAKLPFILSIIITLALTLYTILLLFSFKYTFKPLIIFSIIIAAFSAYAMDSYGFVISAQGLQNIVETDLREVTELINWRLLVKLLFLVIVPLIIIAVSKINYPSWRVRSLHVVLSILLVFVNIVGFGRYYATFLRNNKEIRYYINPLRPIYSLAKFSWLKLYSPKNYAFVELDAKPVRLSVAGKPKLIVLVVGESDRAKNHQLNGYNRNTTPLLAARGDIFSFQNFYSCGTETLVSVPCMFSAFRRTEYSAEKRAIYRKCIRFAAKEQCASFVA